MRFNVLIMGILLVSGLVTGCTLSADSHPTPQIVTATLDPDLSAALSTPPTTATPSPSPTVTPQPTITLIPTQTAAPTMTQPPTLTPVPSPLPPTRTRPAPPPVAAIDDGSGNTIPGTGGAAANFSPVDGLDALPHTLYFLSDYGISRQVFRVQVGLPYAQQLTFSPTGVFAFDVAPDGTLAYTTWISGNLVVDGIPFLPPANPDGSRPQVYDFAWSPDGRSLAYYLDTLPRPNDDPPPPTTGLWLRDASGATRQLYTVEQTEASYRSYQLRAWSPDGSEILVANSYNGGYTYARINVTTGAISTIWDSAYPDPIYGWDSWTADGSAILLASDDSIIRVNRDGSNPVTLLAADAGLKPGQLTQYQDGTITFVGNTTEILSLYALAPDQTAPQQLTEALINVWGKMEIEWGTASNDLVVVMYHDMDDLFGTAHYRDASGTLYDLTPLTGPAGQPQWGPTFTRGDRAIVNSRDPLNVRTAPSGPITRSLVSGAPVIIIDGPRELDGYTWWQIQTPDNQTGWSVESIPAEDGSHTRTLYPASN